MSYCVNCGVELAPSEKSCPLCGTEVINPASPFDPTAARPYPSRHETVRHRMIRITAGWVLMILMAIPLILVLLTDLFDGGGLSWSLIPAAALLFCFMAFVFPCLFKKPAVWLFILFGTLEAAAFLFVLSVLLKGDWFFPFALPAALMTGAALIGGYLMLSAKRPSVPLKMIVVLLELMVYSLLLQLAIELCFFRRIRFDWSIYAAVSCGMLSIAVLIVGRLYRRNEKFRKKMFF